MLFCARIGKIETWMLYKMFSFVTSLHVFFGKKVKLPKYIVCQIFRHLNFADICSLPEIEFIQPNIPAGNIFRDTTYDRNPKMFGELVRKYMLTKGQYKVLVRVCDVSLLEYFACDLVKLLKILIREPKMDAIQYIVSQNTQNPKIGEYLFSLMISHEFFIFENIIQFGYMPSQSNLQIYLITACHHGFLGCIQFLLRKFKFPVRCLQRGIAAACMRNRSETAIYLRGFAASGACGSFCCGLCKI